MAHIVDRAIVNEDTFENMIVLCAMCHGLYDREKKIPKASILVYKANLGLLSHRYTQIEVQLLDFYMGYSMIMPGIFIPIHEGMRVLYSNLLDDGMVEVDYLSSEPAHSQHGLVENMIIQLTQKGVDMLNARINAQELI